MKKYLVLYRAPVTAREQMAKASPEQAKAGMDMWMAWAKRAGAAILEMGAPLGSAAHLGGAASAGDIAGFSIVQAETTDGAKAVFDGHPHLHMPGGSIEVLEFLAMPGMG